MNKKSILANIDVLIAAIKAEPAKRFDLCAYKREGSCGTLHCSAGLAATLPHFKRRGWKLEANGYGDFDVTVKGFHIAGYHQNLAVNEQFGEEAWDRLFNSKWDGDFDRQHPNYNDDGKVTDKQLALWRLNVQRAIYANA